MFNCRNYAVRSLGCCVPFHAALQEHGNHPWCDYRPKSTSGEPALSGTERALSSTSSLTGSDRAFFLGVMANRRNRVTESIRMLEPLVASLSSTHKERAIFALSTLATLESLRRLLRPEACQLLHGPSSRERNRQRCSLVVRQNRLRA